VVGGHQGDRRGSTDVLLLTPAHQFPLGVALSPDRRARAIERAVESGGLVIEDDYDGEFRYDRRPVGAMQAHAPERVVYAGTASKSLGPALRLGWFVAPSWLVPELVAAQRLMGAPTGLEQLGLAELIASGAYDRHVRRARLAYRRRRDRLVTALGRQAPDARISGIEAGLHALVTLPAGFSEDDVLARAEERGLTLKGLGAYSSGAQAHEPALVVGYGTPSAHAFTGAVARLCAVLGSAAGTRASGVDAATRQRRTRVPWATP
jgi:GntR family transcriptional regulator / MocR family aminotransferase